MTRQSAPKQRQVAAVGREACAVKITGNRADSGPDAAVRVCGRVADPPTDSRGRIRMPGWLVVGSAERHAGKTSLACAIIERWAKSHSVVAVKVTAISEGAPCPRGKQSCGACASLASDFEILEETGEHPLKDTARLLSSGASRAFWVRCRRDRIDVAVLALSRRIGAGTLVVAESNSLARVIEPDLFLMVKSARPSAVKPTAAAALSLARPVVISPSGSSDLNLQDLVVVEGVWHLAEASVAVLAGGTSSRMGQDKSLVRIGGEPLISLIVRQLRRRFDEILIGSNEPAKYAFLGCRTISDERAGQGPLRGIVSVVEAAQRERVFVVACDIPVIDLATVERLIVLAEQYDCVIPVSPTGREPLFAVYRKSAAPAMHAALDAGERRISAIFPRVRTGFYDLGPAPWYWNLNTQADLAAFVAATAGDRPWHSGVVGPTPPGQQVQRTAGVWRDAQYASSRA